MPAGYCSEAKVMHVAVHISSRESIPFRVGICLNVHSKATSRVMFLCSNITNNLYGHDNTGRLLFCPSKLHFYANLGVLEVGGAKLELQKLISGTT
jgi:hypothetical protein